MFMIVYIIKIKMASSTVSKVLQTLIGKVIKLNPGHPSAHVSVITMKLEPHVHVYYNTEQRYWAADHKKECKIGDLVLIKELENPESVDVKHGISEVVFPVGHIIDPVNGRRCKGTEYMDMERRNFRPLPTSTKNSAELKSN